MNKILQIIGSMATGGGSRHVNDIKGSLSNDMTIVTARNLSSLYTLGIKTLDGFDQVHCHGPKALVLSAPLLLWYRYCGRKIYFTPHGLNFELYKSPLKIILRQLIVGLSKFTVSKIICVGAAEYSRLAKIFPKHKIQIIYNGVLADTNQIRFKFPNPKNTLSFLFVGRFDRVKNIERILDYACLHPSYQFDFIGNGELLAKIQQRIDDFSLDNAQCLGEKKQADIDYGRYNFFISLSISEGLPYAPLEALSNGVWPILSDIPAHNEIVTLTGLGSILPDQATSLSDILDELAEQKEKTGALGPFTIDEMAKHYQGLYNEI